MSPLRSPPSLRGVHLVFHILLPQRNLAPLAVISWMSRYSHDCRFLRADTSRRASHILSISTYPDRNHLRNFTSVWRSGYLSSDLWSGATCRCATLRARGEVAEWSKAHAWKVCIRQRIEGSNPSLSANYHYKSGFYVFFEIEPNIRTNENLSL